MALTDYAEIQTLANDPALRGRTETAIAKAAQYVIAAGVGGAITATVLANARVAAKSPANEVTKFIWYVVLNIVNAAPTNPDIQFIVDSKYVEIWGA